MQSMGFLQKTRNMWILTVLYMAFILGESIPAFECSLGSLRQNDLLLQGNGLLLMLTNLPLWINWHISSFVSDDGFMMQWIQV